MSVKFCAKIMLFGEYSIILDSMALAMPYDYFSGEFSFNTLDNYTNCTPALDSNSLLVDYLQYLRDLKEDGKLADRLDLDRFEDDINNGLYFDSDIPQGYGVGSSGALVAALYDRYSFKGITDHEKLTGKEIAGLKEFFSMMESYFHGVSSGLDPLLCFINRPLFIRNKTQIKTVKISWKNIGADGAIFLIDSGIRCNTGPLVSSFMERCKKKDFVSLVNNVFIPANNGCIRTLLDGDRQAFFGHLAELSGFQFHYLSEMIPASMRPLWETGLGREDFKMKLCGSGGGGFLLGITQDYNTTMKYFRKNKIEVLPVILNKQN